MSSSSAVVYGSRLGRWLSTWMSCLLVELRSLYPFRFFAAAAAVSLCFYTAFFYVPVDCNDNICLGNTFYMGVIDSCDLMGVFEGLRSLPRLLLLLLLLLQ